MNTFSKKNLKHYVARHSEVGSESQSGRSMVEMLGVLAVVGVLSVAGVAAYNNAMNRHRANELLNEASKRATIVAMQITAGLTPSIAEFGGNQVNGVTFGNPTYTKGDKTFSMALTGVAESVCGQMKVNLGDNTIMALDDTCSQITFNADLSRGVTTNSNSNSGYDENAGAKACTDDTDCAYGCQKCSGSKCISICDVGEYCAQGTSTSDYACVAVMTCTSDSNCSSGCCDTNSGICMEKTPYTQENCTSPGSWKSIAPDFFSCIDSSYNPVGFCAVGTNKGCHSNADCNTPDEYCAITSRTRSCSSPDTGSCLPVGTAKLPTGPYAYGYDGFVYSSEPMTWWGADNWCKAQGMRLVSLADLKCTTSSCLTFYFFSSVFGQSRFWTADTNGSCSVFFLSTIDSAVSRINRSSSSCYALCW